MRKLIMALALCFSGAANADLCTSIYDLSGSIIEARERGTPYSKSIQIAESTPSEENGDKNMVIGLVNWIYELDLSGNNADKEIVKSEFKKEVYLTCVEYFNAD